MENQRKAEGGTTPRWRYQHHVLPACISSPLLSLITVFLSPLSCSLSPPLPLYILSSQPPTHFKSPGEAIVLSVLADNESWWETFLWVLAGSGKLPIQPALHTNAGSSSTTFFYWISFFFFFFFFFFNLITNELPHLKTKVHQQLYI